MIVNYRGFEIEAKRDEPCGISGTYVYYSAVLLEDGYVFIDEFSEGETVRECVASCKYRIDQFYENPEQWDERLMDDSNW